MTTAPLKLGMIGGGQGAFIGGIHRAAAALDGRWHLTAGALSSTPARSIASGQALGLTPDRTYGDWRDMLKAESARPAADRIDAVTIVTPNASHAEIAEAFARARFHIIIDKPMTTTSEGAARLSRAVEDSGVILAVTYNYTGYPMVRQAAAMVRAGQLGQIRKVFVEYHQGWLASRLEQSKHKQAAWRQNAALAGPGGAIADIGTHAENLLSTITGLEIDSLCADLSSLVPGRTLDDDAAILLRFKGGARGVLTASQICIGEQNALTIRIHGEHGSLAWHQETPDALQWHREDGVSQVFSRGTSGLDPAATAATRLPPGHPEGFIEAFANIYRDVADAIHRQRTNHTTKHATPSFPSLAEGTRGVRFIEKAIESSQGGGTWIKF